MPVIAKETFGSPVPYAEPSWYSKGHSSPYYSQSHVEWRARCRKFVEDEVMPNVSEWEKEKAIPMEIYAKCYRAGLLPSLVGPKGYDYADPVVAAKPQGFDYFHELIFIDELCRCGSGGVMWGMMGGLNIGLPTVLNFGTPEMKARVAPPCVRGEKNICLCITEPHAGSDVASIRTTAKLTPDGKHYIVNGQKKWITNGIFSDYFSVAVRTGGPGMKGISMLLVERGMPGLRTTRMDCQGVLSSGTTFVELDDVKVPVENLIGKDNDGFKVIMYNFNHERWGLIIQALRFSRILYELSFKYAQKRKTFGKTLMEHPVIRWKLAEMSRQIEGTSHWLESVTHQMSTMPWVESMDALGGTIALMKAHSTKVFEYCAREAAQIFGGNAYTRSGLGEVVERLYRDVRGLAIPGGSEEILLDLGIRQADRQYKKATSRL
ncbi:Acyl-CoA dehydrogenase, putative [Perkinsus marinus ATCC 50983]|uniref:Acyl-CoA dehydrogenase, putative n=1 Tax=Perkinsus marinus (strain ATCC 50983 / TXsc) TaxID=423536 RepID=C5LY72_PERM5|nr:Acyl-CoA dehydrogenase, putative [Perkinsus marinus ATCC 50983]EEQ98402.1 Acyl-CoA dehydrogenase, putative [Perkinsus marinus ATCC 50983]|eukprot:XP_002765685.1 Acyl-CoA dehydrogenase, putative [Perkinsus marinus ATCC 50983]